MNEDGGSIFLMGLGLGISLGLIIARASSDISSDSPANQIRKAIEVCEANLPRNQHCEIKGVVKE